VLIWQYVGVGAAATFWTAGLDLGLVTAFLVLKWKGPAAALHSIPAQATASVLPPRGSCIMGCWQFLSLDHRGDADGDGADPCGDGAVGHTGGDCTFWVVRRLFGPMLIRVVVVGLYPSVDGLQVSTPKLFPLKRTGTHDRAAYLTIDSFFWRLSTACW